MYVLSWKQKCGPGLLSPGLCICLPGSTHGQVGATGHVCNWACVQLGVCATGQISMCKKTAAGVLPAATCKLCLSPPYLSGLDGAFWAQAYDAGLFCLCLWDDSHQKFGGRCHHVRVAVRRKERALYAK
eukprot:scaffold167960_cov23-Tisochrysis_lutea.AAC.1